ncbi:hypothetical protein LU604_17730 [Erwinia tracheiphila]|uniref:hypothetical protein n=1 Tax=Erwinia tracheiphila TaxID=65700 RepID=UPI001F1D671E|nr:hypothetical protein [Erwinia tracheiphila]UIA82380.1 hypothetical protein LU604_17730 [Erwinia tracheiphila]UIA90976.1 hypothetical protein LU632_17310 [Erwinia tracheiphila]
MIYPLYLQYCANPPRLTLAVRRNWADWDNGWVFKGVYGYTGEFFFEPFRQCGDSGSYHAFRKATGVGFSPYFYNGMQYNFNRRVGIEAGIIFPSIFAATIEWRFS